MSSIQTTSEWHINLAEFKLKLMSWDNLGFGSGLIHLFWKVDQTFIHAFRPWKRTFLTLMRSSLAWGGATSISSITRGLLGSQATAALHFIVYGMVKNHMESYIACCSAVKLNQDGF